LAGVSFLFSTFDQQALSFTELFCGIVAADTQHMTTGSAFNQHSKVTSGRNRDGDLGDDVQFQGSKEFAETWRQEWEQHARLVAATQK